MNLILLFESDFISPTVARLTGRRFIHVHEIIKPKVNDQLHVGKLNGLMGHAIVSAIGVDFMDLDVHLSHDPPAPLALTLLIPMIRPPMFRRLLFHATTLGIKKIFVLNFARVDQGLWNSSSLRPLDIESQFHLGLEQAKDTVMPELIIEQDLKLFMANTLPHIAKGTKPLFAHPGTGDCPTRLQEPVTLAIGPEGGFVPSEVEMFKSHGFSPIDLGVRILRVESALPFIIGRLF